MAEGVLEVVVDVSVVGRGYFFATGGFGSDVLGGCCTALDEATGFFPDFAALRLAEERTERRATRGAIVEGSVAVDGSVVEEEEAGGIDDFFAAEVSGCGRFSFWALHF